VAEFAPLFIRISATDWVDGGSEFGHTPRIASATSSTMRARFSNKPPYSSRRAFESGERNWKQVSVRGVNLDHFEPGAQRAATAAAKESTMPRISDLLSSSGGVSMSRNGWDLVRRWRHPPSLSGMEYRPFRWHMRARLTPCVRELNSGDGSCARRNAAIRLSGSICSSFQIPTSPGKCAPALQPRTPPQGSARTAYGAATQVTKCQSFAKPSVTGVLAHRRDGGAIAEGDIANSQRRKQVCMHR